jgi:aromatic-L-amino-acid decarboxylase
MDSSLGDIDPAEFRRHLHEVADWIADYRENIGKLRISPTAPPGAIRAQLPPDAPEQGEPVADILADVDRVIMPGVMHWAHPQFVGYFGATTTGPGILAEILPGH